MPDVISEHSYQTCKLILTSESELSSSARLGAFRSLFLWGTDWEPEGSALGDADPLVRDRELDVLLPMYGLYSSAQSRTQGSHWDKRRIKRLRWISKHLLVWFLASSAILVLPVLFCPLERGAFFKSQLWYEARRCDESVKRTEFWDPFQGQRGREGWVKLVWGEAEEQAGVTHRAWMPLSWNIQPLNS